MNKSYKDTFKGTARYYARYRAAYPAVFFDMIKDKYNLTVNDRLMDLGCGTGQIAIPISVIVKDVLAVDPEPEMLVEGKKVAQQKGVKNIKWIEGGSEDLLDMADELGRFKLVTIGTAFHWMNRENTLKILYEMIDDEGGLVITAMGATPGQPLIIGETIKKWLGEERRAGSGIYKPPSRNYQEDIKESKFRRIETWHRDLVWDNDIDSLIGTIFSTSYANPNVLGEKKEAFEKDLRDALVQQYPSGKIVSQGKLDVILVWK